MRPRPASWLTEAVCNAASDATANALPIIPTHGGATVGPSLARTLNTRLREQASAHSR